MSRSIRIKGPRSLNGLISIPGDKSISHRVALLASIAEGTSVITRYSASADCASTLACLERLGLRIERDAYRVSIHGQGLSGFRPASSPVLLDAGNSGSTIRMLSGLLAAQNFTAIIDGDASLRRRPMHRIVEPLTRMGARVSAAGGGCAPLRIEGAPLEAIDFVSPVASAQIKACVLFAGLLARGKTTVREPAPSRNHTELLLPEFGADVELADGPAPSVSVTGGHGLKPIDYSVPGDVSSAAFFIAAATVLPGSKIEIRGVGLNPTRTAFIELLKSMGADIAVRNRTTGNNEPVGDIFVRSASLVTGDRPLVVPIDVVANAIDELPILAVVAAHTRGRLEVRGARELRYKESDRIAVAVRGLRAMGVDVEEYDDGFSLAGPVELKGSRIATEGDHRIAMAFSVAALAADGITEIDDAGCAAVSFPEFFDELNSAAGGSVVES